MAELKTLIVIDYQNIHLTAHELYRKGEFESRSLIDPAAFALRVIAKRNERQSEEYGTAVLKRVEMYRGLPSATHQPTLNAAAQAQKSRWSRARFLDITYRPLRYGFDGEGKWNHAEEKGIDVLCAMAVVRGSRYWDLVILASHDTDLEPCLDEALRAEARIETAGWQSRRRLRPEKGALWHTWLFEDDFEACHDAYDYFGR